MENRVYYGEYSLSHWIKLILKENIKLPKYQRGFVWEENKVKELIEALKKKQFVPPVTIGAFRKDNEKENYILDGQQRLTSILLAYFDIFPNKKYFNEDDNIMDFMDDNDDNDSIEDENQNEMKAWKFNHIVELRKTFKTDAEIRNKLKELKNQYEVLDVDKSNFSFDNIFLGFSYIVPASNISMDGQQKYYSSVFRSINQQGKSLNSIERRRSLYFLKEGYDSFFEPEATKELKSKQITKKDIDFVKYLSLLSQYAKDFKINKLAYGYSDSRGKSLENYYEAYIYSVVQGEESQSTLFKSFSSIFPNREYQNRFDELKKIIIEFFDTEKMISIIDIDVYLFGLVYKIIFENKSIDISRKAELLNELDGQIKIFKRNKKHAKKPSDLKHLRIRINKSLAIYNKYEAQQPQ